MFYLSLVFIFKNKKSFKFSPKTQTLSLFCPIVISVFQLFFFQIDKITSVGETTGSLSAFTLDLSRVTVSFHQINVKRLQLKASGNSYTQISSSTQTLLSSSKEHQIWSPKCNGGYFSRGILPCWKRHFTQQRKTCNMQSVCAVLSKGHCLLQSTYQYQETL